jgi:hypothetical protein
MKLWFCGGARRVTLPLMLREKRLKGDITYDIVILLVTIPNNGKKVAVTRKQPWQQGSTDKMALLTGLGS